MYKKIINPSALSYANGIRMEAMSSKEIIYTPFWKLKITIVFDFAAF